MTRYWQALGALSLLSACSGSEDKADKVTKATISRTVDPEARTIEQAADEAAKLVEEESLKDIRESSAKTTDDK